MDEEAEVEAVKEVVEEEAEKEVEADEGDLSRSPGGTR